MYYDQYDKITIYTNHTNYNGAIFIYCTSLIIVLSQYIFPIFIYVICICFKISIELRFQYNTKFYKYLILLSFMCYIKLLSNSL